MANMWCHENYAKVSCTQVYLRGSMFGLIRLLVAEQQERVASSALPTGHTDTHICTYLWSTHHHHHWQHHHVTGVARVLLVVVLVWSLLWLWLVLWSCCCCAVGWGWLGGTTLHCAAPPWPEDAPPHHTPHHTPHTNMYHLYRVQCICMILSWG